MKILVTAREILDNGAWQKFCDDRGINEWAINEGLMEADEQFSLTEEEAKKYGFLSPVR